MGFEGDYEVSSKGRIRSISRDETQSNGVVRHRRGRLMVLLQKKNGYLSVRLCKNGQVRDFLVHRLVATAFIKNTNNLPCVNHKDHNKHNNCVENLEWCSYLYNNQYSNTTEALIKARSKPVVMLSVEGEPIFIFKSSTEAALATGISFKRISATLTGRQKKCGGYRWMFL